jgi:hypothetical protein
MRGVWPITAAICLLAGCTSAEKAARDARQSAGSWGATLSAAAERWGSGEISTRYFEALIVQARTSLNKEASTARGAGGDAAAAPVDAVAGHIDAIEHAVARGDRPAAVAAAHDAASAVPPDKTPAVATPQ